MHEGAVEKYPLSPVLYDGDMKIYKIGVISDLDTDSKVGDNKWTSYFRYYINHCDVQFWIVCSQKNQLCTHKEGFFLGGGEFFSLLSYFSLFLLY